MLIFIVIAQSIAREQVDLNCQGFYCSFLRLKFFSASDALTVLVGLVALFYTRKQVIEGLLPYLAYEGFAETKQIKNTNSNDGFRILIKNIGSGTAIIQNTGYHLSIHAKAYLQLTYDETIDQLRAFGLKPEEDFILRKISPGYGIPKEGELMLFEIIRSQWKDIDWLDCDLDYRGTIGSFYRKEIFCIPRDKERRFPR